MIVTQKLKRRKWVYYFGILLAPPHWWSLCRSLPTYLLTTSLMPPPKHATKYRSLSFLGSNGSHLHFRLCFPCLDWTEIDLIGNHMRDTMTTPFKCLSGDMGCWNWNHHLSWIGCMKCKCLTPVLSLWILCLLQLDSCWEWPWLGVTKFWALWCVPATKGPSGV